jgi:hypothetical protein
MNSNLPPITAHLKPLEGDVFRPICGVQGCDSMLGYAIQEDVLTGETDRIQTNDEQAVIELVQRSGDLTGGAFMEQEALRSGRLESSSPWSLVPLPGRSTQPVRTGSIPRSRIGGVRRTDRRSGRPDWPVMMS